MEKAIRIKLNRLAIVFCMALLVFLFGLNSKWVERLYSDGLYPYTSMAQRAISSVLPFALGDFLYMILVAFCLWSIYKVARLAIAGQMDKQAIKINLIKLVNFILLAYVIFKLLWGLNYSRPSISQRLGINDQKYNTKELIQLGDFLIRRINTIQQQVAQQKLSHAYTVKQLEQQSKMAYDHMARRNPFFNYHVPAVKPVLFSWLISKIGIEGYYCPPSGEANLNMRLPAMVLPFVSCHEISHQLGVAREDEANLVGYLVSTHSANFRFQYSGTYEILRSVLFEIRLKSPEDFQLLYKKINAGTLADFRAERQFWMEYNGDMSAYMNTALDKFLKINNQTKGTDSYQDIVLWVFNLHKREL